MYAIEWRPADPPYARIVNLRDPTPYTEPTTVLKSYDSDSLDLLAIWFTAVKILHVAGALQFLPPLVALIGE